MIQRLKSKFPGLSNAGGGSYRHRVMACLARVSPATVSAFAVIIAATAACGGVSAADTQRQLQVVATTALLADFVNNVGGDIVIVHSLIPPGADVHSFQTTPGDSRRINGAAVIISNGAGLDDFLNPLVQSAKKADGVHIVASDGLLLTPSRSDNRGNVESDPHFWQNPVYAIHYVQRIADGLAQADPDNAAVYRSNATEYIQELESLDREISRILEEIPQARRHLVTFHDAFSHFGARYGWRVTALLANDAGDLSPKKIAVVMAQVRDEGIPAIFAESQFRSKIIDLAAQDTGVHVGIIYSDVLDGDVAIYDVTTYVEMMRFNADSLASLLR